jgi:opacity protein-like surface antigen
MKRFVLVGLSVVGLGLSPPSSAQVSRPTFYAGAGLAVPAAPAVFRDDWSMGFAVTGGAEVGMTPQVSLTAGAEYDGFPFDEGGFRRRSGITGGYFAVDGGPVKVLTGLIGVKLHSAAAARPFLHAAVGMGHVSLPEASIRYIDRVQTIFGSSETNAAFSLGAGFQFKPPGGVLGFFVDGHWTIVLTRGESTQFVPLRAGLTF